MGAGPGVIHQALWSYWFALSCIHFSYLGYGASFASFSLENPRLPALPVGTGMPSPSISQESTTSITCLLDCWGRKGLRRRDWGSGQALLSWEQEGIRRQGASQRVKMLPLQAVLQCLCLELIFVMGIKKTTTNDRKQLRSFTTTFSNL